MDTAKRYINRLIERRGELRDAESGKIAQVAKLVVDTPLAAVAALCLAARMRGYLRRRLFGRTGGFAIMNPILPPGPDLRRACGPSSRPLCSSDERWLPDSFSNTGHMKSGGFADSFVGVGQKRAYQYSLRSRRAREAGRVYGTITSLTYWFAETSRRSVGQVIV